MKATIKVQYSFAFARNARLIAICRLTQTSKFLSLSFIGKSRYTPLNCINYIGVYIGKNRSIRYSGFFKMPQPQLDSGRGEAAITPP